MTLKIVFKTNERETSDTFVILMKTCVANNKYQKLLKNKILNTKKKKKYWL